MVDTSESEVSAKQSAFLHVINGSYEFYFDGGSVIIGDGDTVYLPEGGAYGYRLLSEKAESMQIEFLSFCDGEAFSFAPHPIAVSKENCERAHSCFSKLNRNSGAFGKASAIFELFGCFNDDDVVFGNGESSRILPAIRYIEEHCTEQIYIKDIAELCYISQSQLRRLFVQELGMSPIEFKNHKRMELAMNMLKYTYSQVGEVAILSLLPLK